MKHLFIILFTTISLLTFGQQNSALKQISINAVMPDYDDIPSEALKNLEGKLQNIVTIDGYGDNNAERFLITARIDITTKDIMHTTPPKVSMKMEVTLIIGDAIDNKVYGNYTINTAGIGNNETKAFITAFQRIKPNNPEIQQFVAETKQKILDYYTNNCSFVISEAERKAQMGEFDNAITQLISTPSACTECYSLCQAKAIEVYGLKKKNEIDKLNKQGLELIRQARSQWSIKHDYEYAEKALNLLSQIDPDTPCIEEAEKLINEINSQLRSMEAAEAATKAAAAKQQWEFKMKQYEDNKQAQADKNALLGKLIDRFGRIDISFKKETTKRWGKAK